MIEDVINTVLRAENDYHFAMNNAIEEVERYAQESREKQGDYLEKLRNDFHLYERTQREQFEESLNVSMRKMDEEIAASKEQLKASQVRKAELISERLKWEVLFIWR